jgi:hypothetical protein
VEENMALLVDGGLTTVPVLKEHDTGVFETATGEGIDLAGKLRLAEAEIRAEVERFLARMGKGSVRQVLVSESMRLWHAWKTLEAVYRDAYFSQLNDRYGERWKHYKTISREQRTVVLEEGIGIVSEPLNKPTKPTVVVESGPMAPGAYQLAVSATNSRGEESAASDGLVVSAGLSCTLRVRLGWLPSGATGWMVYAGAAEGLLALQTPSPLPAAGEFVLAAEPLPGRPPVEGQPAKEWLIKTRRLS